VAERAGAKNMNSFLRRCSMELWNQEDPSRNALQETIPSLDGAEPSARTILVAVDFSDWSRSAVRMAKSLRRGGGDRIVALHVIDEAFVRQCVRRELGKEGEIKRSLFLRSKADLRDILEEEGLDGDGVDAEVCEGTPFIEINRKAVEREADLIILGSRGKAGGMDTIFFGTTTEKVLRFITRPVLCVPTSPHGRLQ
jgi:nucleotide-binding universal stress UspA family protein